MENFVPDLNRIEMERGLLPSEEEEEKLNAVLPSSSGKQGPDFVPGEREAAEAALQQAKEEEEASGGQKDIYGNAWPPNLEEDRQVSQEIAKDVTLGVVDTVVGVASYLDYLNPFGDPVTEFKNEYESTFPGHNALRKFSGLFFPMFIGGGIAQSTLGGSAYYSQLPRWKQIVTGLAAEIGVESIVLAGSTSATDDNMIKMFNDTFGTSIIGATSDEYHPSFNYLLNLAEGATITTMVGSLQVWAALRGMKLGQPSIIASPNTEEAAEIIAKSSDINLDGLTTTTPTLTEVNQQIDEILAARPNIAEEIAQSKNFDDPDWVRLDELTSQESKLVTAEILEAPPTSYDVNNIRRELALTEEAHVRFNQPDGPKIADLPYTHDLPNTQKPVENLNVNKVGAVLDNARIVHDPTVGASVRRAVVSNNEIRALVKATPEQHSDILADVVQDMFPDVDAILSDGTVIKQSQIRAEVDNTVISAFNTDPKEFAQDINSMKSMILGTEKFLTDEQFLILGESFKRTFDLALSPDKLRASGMISQQAADNILTGSVAASLLEEVTDTTPQLVNAFENLRLLSGEVNRHKFAKKFGLERIRLLKQVTDPETAQEVSEQLIRLNKEYTEGVGKAIDDGRAITDNLREIAEHNPLYLKPFHDLFLEAGNNVNDLYTMNRWVQNKIGVLKKAIIDGNPEIPSLITQGMRASMYNSILLGASLPKSIAGNAILTVAKPISALLGAGRGTILLNGADKADFRRSLAVYGGVKENFYRGLDLMRRRWKHINDNPILAQKGGRADLRTARSEDLDKINDFKDAWAAEGKLVDGRIAAANMAQLLGWYNGNKIIRSGVNGLHAIDGFFSAFQGTGIARARAYDEIFQLNNGAFNEEYFTKRSAELFDSFFDPTSGLPTDEAVKNATNEISLNQPNFLVNRLEKFLEAVPAAQPVFMFGRTGMNAFDVSWSFMPTSELGLGIGRARKLLRAVTPAEKAAALAEHGIDEFSEAMWLAKKNEYIGRTIAGQSIVLAAGMWALDGNLYGPGPTDAGERQRMMRVMGGNYFYHIKNPITGEWHDYRGMEPFSMILGLVGSIAYEANRTDQAVTEDLYRKVAHAITMNITNQTFFKQFEPLAALLGKDPTAWTRFAANTANMVIPLSGLRSILNNTISPQVKDVERDFLSMLANKGFKAFNTLENEIDIYTGQPINYANPLNAGINALLPFLKSNGGMEPWRQWLVETGWDGGSRIRKNPDTGFEYEPADRQWIHRYIAQHSKLAGQIQSVAVSRRLNQELLDYKRRLDAGQFTQEEFPIEMTETYRLLDKIHDKAYNMAHNAWLHKNLKSTKAAVLKEQVQNQIIYGNIDKAADNAQTYKNEKEDYKELINMNK